MDRNTQVQAQIQNMKETEVKTPKAAAAKRPQTRSFFFYGTLMDPKLLSTIVSNAFAPWGSRCGPEPGQTVRHLRDQRMQKATLFDYERRCVRWGRFPAAVACAGASVEGFLVGGVTDVEARRLDLYEGRMYEAVPARVAMGWGLGLGLGLGLDGKRKGGEEEANEWRSAMVYVWRLGLNELVDTKKIVWTMGCSLPWMGQDVEEEEEEEEEEDEDYY